MFHCEVNIHSPPAYTLKILKVEEKKITISLRNFYEKRDDSFRSRRIFFFVKYIFLIKCAFADSRVKNLEKHSDTFFTKNKIVIKQARGHGGYN